MAAEINEAVIGKIVLFKIKTKQYAIDVDHVVSIEKLTPITRVPNVPAYFKGVINLRGVIIPVIDLAGRLSLGEIDYTEQTRIVIIDKDDISVGFIVDEALDVIDVYQGQIEDPAEVAGSMRKKFIKGVIKNNNELIIVLNIDAILQEGE